ncbi:hypothetical protein RMCBS344292_00165 [Rhizopus microsporus]|nr:hypothetical protein RMCBS344292_00165 [Rhizopus microsporus]
MWCILLPCINNLYISTLLIYHNKRYTWKLLFNSSSFQIKHQHILQEDISNIQEFRRLVCTASNGFLTIGYTRKSRTGETKSSVESSLNLQIQKLQVKYLCQFVFTSCSANADDPVEERDLKNKNKCHIKNSAGDAQDYISMSHERI